MLLAYNYQSCMLKVGSRFSVMNAIDGAWAGPICAQAKRFESGGRKVRRLSKEKRKEMVESFIKKYQGSNNGNFPSLNLTHKEVGGSFYTIREIVRDIIQENRVLGPAKSMLEEQDSDQSFKQFPLGTISTEPEISVSMPEDGIPNGSYQHEETSEELFFVSDKVFTQPDNNHIINGSRIANDIEATNGQVIETTKNMEEAAVSSTKVTEMADVIVETFPLPPITQPTDESDGNSVKVKDLKGSLSDGIEIDSIASEEDSGLLDRKAVRDATDLSLGNSNSRPTENGVLKNIRVDEDVDMMLSSSDKAIAESKVMDASNGAETNGILRTKVTEMADVIVETFPPPPITQSTNESHANSIEVKDLRGPLSDGIEVDSKASEGQSTDLSLGNLNSCAPENGALKNIRVDMISSSSDKAVAETKVMDASNVTETKGINGNYTSVKEVIDENNADVQHSGSSEKKSNPTLDRINLESWEVESQTPKKSSTNPMVAALKSIIAAFTNFWS